MTMISNLLFYNYLRKATIYILMNFVFLLLSLNLLSLNLYLVEASNGKSSKKGKMSHHNVEPTYATDLASTTPDLSSTTPDLASTTTDLASTTTDLASTTTDLSNTTDLLNETVYLYSTSLSSINKNSSTNTNNKEYLYFLLFIPVVMIILGIYLLRKRRYYEAEYLEPRIADTFFNQFYIDTDYELANQPNYELATNQPIYAVAD